MVLLWMSPSSVSSQVRKKKEPPKEVHSLQTASKWATYLNNKPLPGLNASLIVIVIVIVIVVVIVICDCDL